MFIQEVSSYSFGELLIARLLLSRPGKKELADDLLGTCMVMVVGPFACFSSAAFRTAWMMELWFESNDCTVVSTRSDGQCVRDHTKR